MTDEQPLYERDPGAWQAHLAEGNRKQARKRVSVDALLRDAQGRILLVDPQYKPDWDMPGGMVEANEPPDQALQRELLEELNLTISVGRILCIDWVSPHGPWDDLLALIFDAGTVNHLQLSDLCIHDEELSDSDFCTPEVAATRLRPHVWRRLAVALEAERDGATRYLRDGR